jgi:hypothetical protein
MPPKKGTAQQPKAVIRHQCGSCNEIFTGKACPSCGEKINIWPINADGISLDEVAGAVGATHGLPINLSRSPDLFDADEVIDIAMKQQMRDVIQDANLDKVKTLAADQAAKRIRAEETLKATREGFVQPELGAQQQEDQSGFASMSPGIFLQALGGWDPEQREQFLNQLASNPMLALNLSMMMNPGKAGGMNPMGMMNPMAMMGGMMQPPAEPAPQADPATMLTAVIAAVQSMQEMSGGNKGNDAQMERMLDKMDEMRRETEDLKLQLVESQNRVPEVSYEDIRRIVADAVNTTTDGKIGLINGLKEIHTLKDELIGLGIASEPTSAVDPAQTLAEREFNHKVKMDEKRDARDHELSLKAEEAVAAKANVQSEFMSGLFAAAQEQHDEKEKDDDGEKIVDKVVKADPRSTAVIS